MKLTEIIAVFVGVMLITTMVEISFNNDKYQYTQEYGEVTTQINPLLKVIIDNQTNLFFGMVGLSCVIVGCRWDKFTKNTKSFINILSQKMK